MVTATRNHGGIDTTNLVSHHPVFSTTERLNCSQHRVVHLEFFHDSHTLSEFWVKVLKKHSQSVLKLHLICCWCPWGFGARGPLPQKAAACDRLECDGCWCAITPHSLALLSTTALLAAHSEGIMDLSQGCTWRSGVDGLSRSAHQNLNLVRRCFPCYLSYAFTPLLPHPVEVRGSGEEGPCVFIVKLWKWFKSISEESLIILVCNFTQAQLLPPSQVKLHELDEIPVNLLTAANLVNVVWIRK